MVRLSMKYGLKKILKSEYYIKSLRNDCSFLILARNR